MSGPLREVLHDIAGEEVRGLRIDLAAATERGRRRQLRLRWGSSKVMMLAAAAAVLGVLLPVLLVVGTVRPADKNDRYATAGQDWRWLPPDRVPLATNVRMNRAQMLLAMLPAGGWNDKTPRSWPLLSQKERGPVVLSADGKTYASLPWDTSAGLYTLFFYFYSVSW